MNQKRRLTMQRDIGCDCCWLDNMLDRRCPNCGTDLLDVDPIDILTLTFSIKGRGPVTNKYARVCRRTCAYRGSIALMGAQIGADTQPAHYDPLPPNTKKVYLIGWFRCRMALVYVHGADVPYLVVLGEVTHGILNHSQWWLFSFSRRLTSKNGVTWDFDELPTDPIEYTETDDSGLLSGDYRLLAVYDTKQAGKTIIMLEPQLKIGPVGIPCGDPICIKIPSDNKIARLAVDVLDNWHPTQNMDTRMYTMMTFITRNKHLEEARSIDHKIANIQHNNDMSVIPYYKPKKRGLPFRYIPGCMTVSDYGIKIVDMRHKVR